MKKLTYLMITVVVFLQCLIANAQIMVQKINVSTFENSNKIIKNGGTLKMIANILPIDATIQNVKWEIVNGNNLAYIDLTGVIHTYGTSNGDITVRATSTDSSKVFGEAQVQVATPIIFHGWKNDYSNHSESSYRYEYGSPSSVALSLRFENIGETGFVAFKDHCHDTTILVYKDGKYELTQNYSLWAGSSSIVIGNYSYSVNGHISSCIYSPGLPYLSNNPIPQKPILNLPVDKTIIKTDSIQLDWSDAARAYYYSLQLSDTINFSRISLEVNNILSSHYTIKSLPIRKKYFWRVLAINDLGSSLYSDTLNFTYEGSCVPKLIRDNISICKGDTYKGHSESCSFVDSLKTLHGCDSIITTNLTVNPEYNYSDKISICEGASYKGHTTKGTYIENLKTFNGCDSIITTYLTVNPEYSRSDKISICDGDSYKGHSVKGTYIENLKTFIGCDSIITTYLTVNPKYNKLDSISICEGESYKDHTTTGTYLENLKTANGCDSIILTRLIVFLKFICNSNGNTMIYTSRIKIYPNPTNGIIKIAVDKSIDHDCKVELFNSQGSLIFKTSINSSSSIDLSKFSNGLYILKIYSNEGSSNYKVLKE